MENASPQFLAQQIQDCQIEQPPHLVALNPRGAQPPLFLIHSISGDLLVYRALVDALSADQPIYGLQAHSLTLGTALISFDAVARQHIHALRQIQPQGPYHLIGWSIGGLIAYEMATQLLASGESIAFLGLLDSPEPQTLAKLTDNDRQRLIDDTVTATVPDDPACLPRLEQAQWSSDQTQQPFNTRHTLLNAAVDYSPQPLPIKLHLFAAQDDTAACPRAQHSTWTNWVHRVQRIDVAGDHNSLLMAPYVQTLASQLATALNASAQGDTPAHTPMIPCYTPVIPLQQGQAGHATLICIPGAGDTITTFMPLTRALGDDMTLLGLHHRGLNAGEWPFYSVEHAAAQYQQALDQRDITGPCHIIGHSFGGWLAIELALRYQQAGRPVAQVWLLDSEAPMPATAAGTAPASIMRHPVSQLSALDHLVHLLEQSTGQSLATLQAQLPPMTTRQRCQALLEHMIALQKLPARATVEGIERLVRLFQIQLNTPYTPHLIYRGRVTLINATDSAGKHPRQTVNDRIKYWQHHVMQLTSATYDGNHMTLLTSPYVTCIAQTILKTLKSAAPYQL